MWFATEAKVYKALEELIVGFGALDGRVNALCGTLQEASGAGIVDPELAGHMHQLRIDVMRNQTGVRQVRVALNMGVEPWREAIAFVDLARSNLALLGKHIAQLEAGAEDGRQRAIRDLGVR